MGWVGNNSWTRPPFFSRHLVPQNVGNIFFRFLFSQYWVGVEKNQCSRHFSKKSIPGLFYLEPHRKVNATTLELFTTHFKNLKTKRPTRFQTLTFWWNLGFQKPGICPRQPPGGFIFPEMTPNKKKSIILADHKNRYFSTKWLPFLFFCFWAPVGRAL